MKFILSLLILILLLSGCKEKEQSTDLIEPEQEQTFREADAQSKMDTIHNFQAVRYDTIVDKRDVRISNMEYRLELLTFSLNDSSVVRQSGTDGSYRYVDHLHKTVTEVKLMNDAILDRIRIDKTNFKKSLDPEFYSDCNLMSTRIDSLKDRTVYLTTDLAIPETDDQWRVWYTMDIVNDKLSKIVITHTDYVGL